MTDCPHTHEPDTGLQTFKDIIREEFDQASDSIRRDRSHRGVRRLQRLVRTQPSQPGQRTPSLQLRVGDLQSRNAQHTRTQVVQGHPSRHRNNPSGCSGCSGCRWGAGMISKVHPIPKLDRPSLSFGGCSGCSGCKHFEKLFAPGVADSLKLIQANSTPGIPLTPLHPYHVQQSKDPGLAKTSLAQPRHIVVW